MRSREM